MSNTTKETKVKKHTNLFNLLNLQPGITREQIIANDTMQRACLTKAQVALLSQDDPSTLKRWGRQVNRYLRMIRRDGHEIIITRTEGVANYTLAESIPDYTAVADEPTGNDDQFVTSKQPRVEEPTQVVSFADLMADLDNDAINS